MRLEQAGAGWHVPLLRAAMAGELRLAMVGPGLRIPLSHLDMTRHPRPFAVVLNGDGGGPAGPDAFPQAARLLRWAGFIILHGAGAERVHYDFAVAATITFRRLVLVETTSAALPAWTALREAVARTTPSLGIAVPDGGLHPVEGPAPGETVQ